jgi:hypothetical protein
MRCLWWLYRWRDILLLKFPMSWKGSFAPKGRFKGEQGLESQPSLSPSVISMVASKRHGRIPDFEADFEEYSRAMKSMKDLSVKSE